MRRIAMALVLGTLAGCGGLRSAHLGGTDVAPHVVRSGEVFPGGPEQVAEACREAMTDLAIQRDDSPKVDPAVERAGGDPTSAHATPARPLTLAGKAADGRAVRVELRPMGASTLASVSVGRNGDVPYARALLDRVGLRLGTKPPDPLNEAPTSPPPTFNTPLFSRKAVPDSEMLRDQIGSMYRDSPAPQ